MVLEVEGTVVMVATILNDDGAGRKTNSTTANVLVVTRKVLSKPKLRSSMDSAMLRLSLRLKEVRPI